MSIDFNVFIQCWGCTVWLPCIYTSHTLYLVNHPYHLGLPLTTALMVVGAWSIYTNYEADNQKLTVRKNIKCKIWGRKSKLLKQSTQLKMAKLKKQFCYYLAGGELLVIFITCQNYGSFVLEPSCIIL